MIKFYLLITQEVFLRVMVGPGTRTGDVLLCAAVTQSWPIQIKSNQIKIFISINNDDNNRYSTYKGNIVMCIIIHLHTFKYIYTHTYY